MSAPEYAFIASEATRVRARGAVAALNALGYDARHYGADAAEARRAKVVVFCDVPPDTARFVYDVFEEANFGLAKGAYAITAATPELSQRAATRLGREVEVVPDPLEGPRRPPRTGRVRGGRSWLLERLAKLAGLDMEIFRVRLLWTGGKEDIETIVGAYPGLKALGAEMPLSLRCVAAPEVLEALLARVQEDAPKAVRLAFEAASPLALALALEQCDFLLLPREERLRRMALHAGRHAIVGENPCQAIRWALAHPMATLEELQRAQRLLDQVHAPEVVARAWARILMKGSR